MPSPRVGGPLSLMKLLWFATSTSKQNAIYTVASWDLHMFRKMQIWFCSSFLFTALTISAHENIIPRSETLNSKQGIVVSTLLGPPNEVNNKQWPLSCGQNLFCNFPPWAWSGRSPKPYKLGIGRYRWVLPLNLQNMQSTAAPRKQHQNHVWNWCPVFIIWTWNIYWGYRFWVVPYGLCRFHELLQSWRQLLTTLFIQ